MQAASVKELKQALSSRSPQELMELVLRLARSKKENKELLTYLLFEAQDETHFIESIKAELSGQFEQINTRNFYLMKKGVRRILRITKKYIGFSGKKETEVELLLHFCFGMKALRPSIVRSTVLHNLYAQQLSAIRKALSALHEDLQYDYQLEIDKLREMDG